MTSVRLRHIDRFKDRHGKERFYYRAPGCKRIPLPGKPGTPEFMLAYQVAAEGSAVPIEKQRTRGAAGTFDRLAGIYFASQAFRKTKPQTQANTRGIIERFLAKHGHRQVAQMRHEHVSTILGSMAATPAAANNLLKKLRVLIGLAIVMRWRPDDPTLKIEKYNEGEFHTWTDDEIAAFEARWPAISRERMAFDLHIHTGQRRGDVVRMAWSDCDFVKGYIAVAQEKTNKKLRVAMHPDLKQALLNWRDHLAQTGDRHAVILATKFGKPFSAAGYGNWMARVIGKAGVPDHCVPHGLRKAAARRLAEAGCSTKEIMSVTGHDSYEEVERYTQAANQESLSKAAIARLSGERPATEVSQPVSEGLGDDRNR